MDAHTIEDWADYSIVLGGTGFVGSHLIDHLVEAGASVVAAVRSEPPRSWSMRGIRHDRSLIDFLGSDTDITDAPPDVITLIRGARTVYDLAANASYGDGASYRADAERAVRLGALIREYSGDGCRLVFASSIAAAERTPGSDLEVAIRESDQPSPCTDYGRAKLDVEGRLLEIGIPVSIARLGWVIGRGMRPSSHIAVFTRLALQRGIAASAPLAGIAPLVHVDDAVRALVLLSEVDELQLVVNVAAENVRISEIMSHAARRRDRDRHLPRPVVERLGYKMRCLLRGELRVDSSLLRSLGWEPRVGWRDAVDEVAAEVGERIDVSIAPPRATVVTGAGSGLGLEITRQLAATGRNLILVDRSEATTEVAEALGARLIVGDVTDPALDDEILLAAAEFDGVSEVFMCAGVGNRGRFGLQPESRQLDPLSVNLVARARMSHVMVREMRQHNFGRLVLISSSTALVPMPEFSSYAASNAGLLSLGTSLADEWRSTGIQVLTVLPAGMQTNFQAAAGVREIEGERLLDPADVARDVMKALDSGASVAYVGSRTKLLNLAGRFVPRRAAAMVMGRLARAYR